MAEKKTAGQIALDLHEKDTVLYDPIELQREMQNKEKFEAAFWQRVEAGKKKYPGDFFIVYLTWRDRVFPKKVAAIMIPRQTCIRPSWGQTVWRYVRQHDAVEELWTIPDQETCVYYMEHVLEVDESEKALLNNILKFTSGELDILYNQMTLIYNKPADDQLTSSKNKLILDGKET